MSKFESLIAGYMTTVSSDIHRLTSALKAAFPTVPIHEGTFGFPYAALAEMKLMGECSFADTIRMLTAAGVTHEKMPVIRNYLLSRDEGWEGKLPFNFNKYFGRNTTEQSDFIHQTTTPLIFGNYEEKNWELTLEASAGKRNIHSSDNSPRMKFKMREGGSECRLAITAGGEITWRDIKTFVEHRNEVVDHQLPVVFSKEAVNAIGLSVEAELERYAVEMLGGPITIDELGCWFMEHIDLLHEFKNPPEWIPASMVTEKRVKPGSYWQFFNPAHVSLSCPAVLQVLHLSHYDKNCSYEANVSYKVNDAGERTYDSVAIQYKLVAGTNAYSEYRVNSYATVPELHRLKNIFSKIIDGLKLKKEEQEAAPPADTPAE